MSTALPNYHIAKLDNGIEFAYTDSGIPSSANYTTLVILHGAGFISKYHTLTTPTQILTNLC